MKIKHKLAFLHSDQCFSGFILSGDTVATSKFLMPPPNTEYPKSKSISTFRAQRSFFESLENPVFCSYLRKYQNSRKRYYSLGLFEKVVCPICPKYQHFEQNYNILRPLSKNVFVHISENINISTKTKFLETILKTGFLSISP